jgi:hypothetical protein
MPHTDRAYPFKILPEYPGLRPEDVEIWKVFIKRYPNAFLKVWYNWHVGLPRGQELEYSTPAGVAWYDLTRWKIDVVAEDEKFIYIIEIKPHANAKAIGQALGYADLWDNETTPWKPLKPMVLTDLIIENTQTIADRRGVLLVEV